MPGPLLHLGALVTCSHMGQAAPIAPNARVFVSGMAVVPVTSQYQVVGCTLPPPPAANGPCVTGQFMTSATRVFVSAQPVLLIDSQSTCIPTGTPLIPNPAGVQPRVIGM